MRHRGFTMIELLLVVVIVAAMMAFAMPKFSVIRDQSSARASRLMLAAAFSTARAAAVQKGQPSTLVIDDEHRVTVTVLSGLYKTEVEVVSPMYFNGTTNAMLTVLDGTQTVSYDPRGMLSPLLENIARFELTVGSARDTLCISPSGFIMPRDCRL